MAGVGGEGLFLDEEGDQSNMAAVHSLDRKSLSVDLDVDHLDEILN